MWMDCIIGFAIAFVCTFVATPFVRRLAIKVSAIDVPKDDRRMHTDSVPRMGGLAIFIGIIISLIYVILTFKLEYNTQIFDKRIIGYIIGAILLLIMGMIDDRKSMKAIYKLIIQIIAAGVVIYFGVKLSFVSNPFGDGIYYKLGIFEIPITIIWIVGITNAINFIDGLDGLATGITCISSLSLLFIFLITGQSIGVIYIATIIVAATLGFLPFNFNPARIFMGDTGSNFLGFSLAVLSIMGFAKTYTVISIIAPVIILGVPIFDTGFAIIRRLIKGQSPMQADKGHLHHRLINAGLSIKQAVFILYGACVMLGMLAIVLVESSMWKVIILIIAIMLFMYTGLKYMGKEDMKKLNEGNNKKQ